ncbi:ROK family transcriptional regulator [Luedemannella flava]|uniref:ROK family transcriptional regulator n=1 Tax=Luedemannella flava TaxID=349316 RepID=A0ABP4YQ56_9ACTN
MTVETPGSQTALRESNQRRVIHAVRSAGALTQAEIARTTGLSAATVSNIVRELREAGTLVTTPTSSGGRRAQSVSMARPTGLLVGVEIGASRLRAVLCDHEHRILSEESIPYDSAPSVERGLRRAEWLVSTLLLHARVDRASVRGVGVAAPGPIEAGTGRVGAPALLPAWHDAEIAAELGDRLDIPVHVDNDANAAALGEQVWGAGQGVSDLVYLKLSDAIGAGLVLRGEIFTGAAGLAGEIGHITVDEQGRICRCGNRGCLETLVGGPYLLDLLPAGRADGPPTLHTLVTAALDGDLGSRRVVADAGRAVGTVAAMLCNVLNPQRVIVGGDLAEAEDLLLDPIRESLQRRTLPSAAATVEVVPAELGARATALGAVASVERMLASAAESGARPL